MALMAAPTRVLPFASSATIAQNSSARPLWRTILLEMAALPALKAVSRRKDLYFFSHAAILDQEPAPMPVVIYLAALPFSGSVYWRRQRRRLAEGAQRANERMNCQASRLARLVPGEVAGGKLD